MRKMNKIASSKYLGNPIDIVYEYEALSKPYVEMIAETIVIKAEQQPDLKEVKVLIERFYKKKCKALIEKRIAYYVANFKEKPKSVTIEVSFNKWGSCNSKRELTFNYLLITKPLEQIDYVVVHELCHMKHLNHDRSFQRCIGAIIPKYKQVEALFHSEEL